MIDNRKRPGGNTCSQKKPASAYYLKSPGSIEKSGIISSRVRHTTLVVLWSFIGVSAVLLISRLWAVALLLLVALAVTVHLYSLPTEARVPARD